MSHASPPSPHVSTPPTSTVPARGKRGASLSQACESLGQPAATGKAQRQAKRARLSEANTGREEVVIDDEEDGQDRAKTDNPQCEDGVENATADGDGGIDKKTPTRRRLSVAQLQARSAERERQQRERIEKAEQIRAMKEEKLQLKLQEKRERELQAEQKKAEKERLAREKEEQRKEKDEQKRLAEAKRKADEEARREKRRLEEESKKEKRRMEEEAREMRRKTEEERKEHKRREEMERERSVLKQQEKFRSYFRFEKRANETTASSTPTTTVPFAGRFRPFQLKEGMTLAPIFNRPPLSRGEYDALLQKQETPTVPYLTVVKRRGKLVGARKIALRAKLLQFHSNYRPPYYGTWRTRSRNVTGRRPWGKHKTIDYEVDSDEEWEEEPEDADECLSDADDDDEEDEMDEDDGFFVDHGYLSDGEGEEDPPPRSATTQDDTETPTCDHADDPAAAELARRERLAEKAELWRTGMRAQCARARQAKLIPRVLGPCWAWPRAHALLPFGQGIRLLPTRVHDESARAREQECSDSSCVVVVSACRATS